MVNTRYRTAYNISSVICIKKMDAYHVVKRSVNIAERRRYSVADCRHRAMISAIINSVYLTCATHKSSDAKLLYTIN
jgi:hypothetical protein